MNSKFTRRLFSAAALVAGFATLGATPAAAKDIVYLTPGLDLPFWRYLSKGVEAEAKKAGFGYQALDSRNSAQTQLKNAQDSIARGVAGIVISPTDSSTAPGRARARRQGEDPRRDCRHRHQRRGLCLLHHFRQP